MITRLPCCTGAVTYFLRRRFILSETVKKELDKSVEIVKVTVRNLDPYGAIEDGDLSDALSPEVLWGRENLIDFTSPSEYTPTFTPPPHHVTIGLSMDPLTSTRETIQQTSTPVPSSNSDFDSSFVF